MPNLVAKILVGMLKKFVTEKFLSRIVILAIGTLAKSTENTVDDAVCKAVGDALGNPCDV
jgi:hypothetical protein